MWQTVISYKKAHEHKITNHLSNTKFLEQYMLTPFQIRRVDTLIEPEYSTSDTQWSYSPVVLYLKILFTPPIVSLLTRFPVLSCAILYPT